MADFLLVKKVEKIVPHVTSWFESEIDFNIFREFIGKDEAESIVIEALVNEGFPPNVQVNDVNFDFIAMNKKETKQLISEYIEVNTNLENTATQEEIEQIFTSETSVIDFRLKRLDELNIHMVVNDDLADFMERHAYYDDNYFAKRMGELFDINVLKPMIESREAMSLNQEYFTEKFRYAVSDMNILPEDVDENTTPIKVIDIKLEEPIEAIAEQFSPKLYEYNTVTNYLNSDFYDDLIKEDKIYFVLELNIDEEDYKN